MRSEIIIFLKPHIIFHLHFTSRPTDESIKDLSLHIQIEQAIATGKLTITDGDYEQGFADLLELLGIDEEELDDEDAMNIKLKLAVKSGDLAKYLDGDR